MCLANYIYSSDVFVVCVHLTDGIQMVMGPCTKQYRRCFTNNKQDLDNRKSRNLISLITLKSPKFSFSASNFYYD